MSMPRDLVFVRHGQSEGNIVQRSFKEGPGMEVSDKFINTHDWQYRLSAEGVEQAKKAGLWLASEFGDIAETFDERYTSPYIRTRETAAYLGGSVCKWLLDDRLTERDWGIYNSVNPRERSKIFAYTEHLRSLSSLRWRPDGGESLTSEVLLRFRDWLDTLHREQSDKRVIAVTHGELMWVARYILERMLPEEWESADNNKSQRLFNCSILWYTRVNPEDPNDVSKFLKWRRMVRPDDVQGSPFGGKWVLLEGKRRFTGEELLKTVEAVPRIFPDSSNEQ